jgi:hypothetical protein
VVHAHAEVGEELGPVRPAREGARGEGVAQGAEDGVEVLEGLGGFGLGQAGGGEGASKPSRIAARLASARRG